MADQKLFQPGVPGPGIAKGSTVVRNENVKRIQALAMMRELAGGKSLADVAVKFNVSQHIVRARLNFAQRAGLFTHHEDVILRGMVPLAEDVLIERLLLGDKEVALEVYKGTGLFRKPGTRAPAATETDGKGEVETLESHIAKLRTAKQLYETEGVIDAEFESVFRLLGESTGDPGAGGDQPASPAAGVLPDATGAHGETAEAAGEAPGATDAPPGDGQLDLFAALSGEAESGAGEPGGRDFSAPEHQGTAQ